MKSIMRLGLCLAMAMLLGACTQPNGKIGLWFGQWIFESIEDEEGPLTDNPQQFNLRFQGAVVVLTQTTAENDLWPKAGTWTEEDGVLTLNFESEVRFSHLLGFGTAKTVRLRVDELTSKDMKLTLLGTDNPVTYSLKKSN